MTGRIGKGLSLLGMFLLAVGVVLCTVSGAATPSTQAMRLPGGTAVSNLSRKSIPELGRLMAESCEMAMESMKTHGSQMGQAQSETFLDKYTRNMKTAAQIYGLIQKKAKEIGPGFISVQFPEGTGQLYTNSFEYERLIVFLRYISRDSHGRKVDFVLVGTEPTVLSGSASGIGILAEKRVASVEEIINRNLANIPHHFYRVYCNGDILNPANVKKAIPPRNVYIAAIYEGAVGAGTVSTPSSNGVRQPGQMTPPVMGYRRSPAVYPRCIRPRFKNSIGMEFVYIPPGTFVMGSPPKEYGHDLTERQHVVVFTKGFYMQTTEVTQGEWKAIMGSNPSYFLNCGDDCPVENVSWYDAQEFIERLNEREGTTRYRLPTEAEWEYACRAGTETPFANGGTITKETLFVNPSLGQMGWYYSNSEEATHSVAQKRPNAWGLYDMHGNVWEWCQDWMAQYPFEVSTNPKGPPSGLSRVRRGGSWQEYPVFCRSAYRGSSHPKTKSPSIGFRLVMDLKPPKRVVPQAKKAAIIQGSQVVARKPCGLIRDIDFDFNSAKIKPEMKLVLDKAVQILKKQKGKILLEGFTCSLGSDAYNLLLSERRVKAVREYLIKKGISSSRIETKWFGKKRPEYSNKYEAGRRLNRRVEIHLISE